MRIPLDSDGFARRQCPTCERELKWPVDTSDEADSILAPDGGYFCPYCALQGPPDAWHTQAQIEHAQALIAHEIVGPELNRFKRTPGFTVEITAPKPQPLTEVDDMRCVNFTCHPGEAVKVLDDWQGPVHCPLCSTASA